MTAVSSFIMREISIKSILTQYEKNVLGEASTLVKKVLSRFRLNNTLRSVTIKSNMKVESLTGEKIWIGKVRLRY